MKKLIGSLVLISIFLFGCYKTDPAVEELLKQIQPQNDALKVQVAAMQKSSDYTALERWYRLAAYYKPNQYV